MSADEVDLSVHRRLVRCIENYPLDTCSLGLFFSLLLSKINRGRRKDGTIASTQNCTGLFGVSARQEPSVDFYPDMSMSIYSSDRLACPASRSALATRDRKAKREDVTT